MHRQPPAGVFNRPPLHHAIHATLLSMALLGAANA